MDEQEEVQRGWSGGTHREDFEEGVDALKLAELESIRTGLLQEDRKNLITRERARESGLAIKRSGL